MRALRSLPHTARPPGLSSLSAEAYGGHQPRIRDARLGRRPQRNAAAVHNAVALGLIDIDQFEERSALVSQARMHSDLDALVFDLPGPASQPGCQPAAGD